MCVLLLLIDTKCIKHLGMDIMTYLFYDQTTFDYKSFFVLLEKLVNSPKSCYE